ncbi:MAG: hypothetical protein JRE43_05015 [Deltaproteobacteria bacterium]|nr:hypothetical protein [Deltaproteobacteria bacterium]
MKTLLKIALSLLGLIVALGVVAFIYLDSIVGKAIETGCTKALGVETRVGWVRVGLVTGKFGIGQLEIANPSGFETDHFIAFDRIHFEIPPKSLREDTIVMPLLELDGVDVAIETAAGKKNYEVILDNLKRFSDSGAADPAAEKEAAEDAVGGKSFVLREGVIREVVATIDLGKVKGGTDRVVVEIPEIRLHPSKSGASAEVSIAEIAQTVVTAVLTGVAKKAPAALAKGLYQGLGGLTNASLEIPGLLSETGSSAGEGARKFGEGVSGAIKGIGGLFGGGDKQEKD